MADNQDKVSPAPADAPPSKTPADTSAAIDSAVDESAALDSSDPSKTHHNIIEHARAAAHKERKMTLRQGIKLYPKAIFWSILISTCIAMEGYDISLVNNFCMPLNLLVHLTIYLFSNTIRDAHPASLPSAFHPCS